MTKKNVGDARARSHVAHGTAAVASFRSPVGCTSDTPGEQEFLSWCQEERIRFPSSHLTQLADTGRALVASRAIKMGEVVVEVPDNSVLMAENCTIHEVLEEEGMCKPADDEILEVQGLVIAVMFEKWRGAESPWASYLALLPDDMTHMPLYWKRREFEELRGTAAYDKMLGQVQHPADAPTQVPLLWCEVVEPFISEHPELRLPDGERGYELFRWATCAVASYSFILGDDKYQAMVPVWDLLNHITGRVNVRLHHCAKRHLLQMIATRDIAAGEELVNNYGELSNAELLRGYGFVERTNKNNHAQVPLSFLTRAARQVLEAEESAPRGGRTGSAAGANGARAATGAAAGPSPGSAAGGPDPEDDAGALRRRLAARLRLGRRLGLLPQHHVFKVYKGRPPPAAMTVLAYLLVASDDQAAVLRDAGRKAAARGRAAEEGGGQSRKQGGKGGKAAQLRGQAAAAAAVDAVAAALAGDVAAERRVVQVYGRIVERMLGRYSCSLEEDRRILQQYDTLPPRLRAALLARMPEKEALGAVAEEVRRKGALQRSLAQGLAAVGPGNGKAGSQPSVGGRGSAVVGSGGEDQLVRLPQSGRVANGAGASARPTEVDAGFSFGFRL